MIPFVSAIRCVLLVLLLGLATAATLTCRADQKSKAETFVVPFVPLRDHGAPLVQVLINGKLTGKFMIDTGGGACLISKSLASKLGLKMYPAELSGFLPLQLGDDNRVQLATNINSLQLGDLRLTSAPFIVIDDDDFFQPEQQMDGIIGGPILSQFAMFVDFPRRFLAIITPGHLSEDERAKMNMGDASVVPLSESDESGYVNAGTPDLDSGSVEPGPSNVEMEAPTSLYVNIPLWIYTASVQIASGSKSAKETPFVDTGAPFTSIPIDTANKLSLSGFDYLGGQTLYNGAALYNVGKIDQFKVGNLALSNFDVVFPSSKDSDIPPLIGEDVLSYGIALFDFPANTLYIKPTMPPIQTGSIDVNPNKVLVDKLEAAAGDLWFFPGKGLSTSSANDEDDVDGAIAAITAKLKGDATDVPLIMKVGDLLQEDGQADAAQAQFAKAVDLWTTQLKTSPADPKAQAGLAVAFVDEANIDQAEKAAREETVQLPDQSAGWMALAKVLECKAEFAISGNVFPPISSDHDITAYLALISKLQSNPPDPSMLTEEKAEILEARKAMDEAVSLSPNDPDQYESRATILGDIADGIDRPLLIARSGTVSVLKGTVPDQCYLDKDHAGLLSSDADVIDSGISADINQAVFRSTSIDFRESHFWKSLPKDTQSKIQAQIAHLTALSKSADPEVSVAAESELGTVQYAVLHDKPTAEATLKSVIAAHPDSGTAVDALVQMLSADRRYDDLITDLSAVDPAKQTAQIHMALARCYLREQKFDQAVTETPAAITLKPNSFLCNIMLAGLLLRNPSATSADMSEAKACLDRSQSAIGGNPDQEMADALASEQAIFQALTGDFTDAAQGLIAVLQKDRTDTQARAALASLLM